jgi:hypothetical protein
MRLEPRPNLPSEVPALVRRLSELLREVNGTVNAISEGAAAAHYTARISAPTTGVYAKGDYVHNADPVKAGTAGSRYVIYGWKRLTSGDAHVMFTDWVEDRRFSGD